MNSYFVFTDEAGCYMKQPNETHRNKHPFYIRSNVVMSTDDYRVFQSEIQALNEKIKLPLGEEIKWSDLGGKTKNNPRNDYLKKLKADTLKGYYRQVLTLAKGKPSLKYIFTITDMRNWTCRNTEEDMMRFHLQEVFQRVQMDLMQDDFAIVIMDELEGKKVKTLKQACHTLTETGDFIKKYSNVYHGVVTENSAQSAGVQLADFAAGILNCYLRRCLYQKDNFEFANDLYGQYIKQNLRKNEHGGSIIGYGIRPIPNSYQAFKTALIDIFDKGEKI